MTVSDSTSTLQIDRKLHCGSHIIASTAELGTDMKVETPLVHIIRHGQSLHNVERGYPHRDPPLTDLGISKAAEIKLPSTPDLIVLSPMTRTIQTALVAFDTLIGCSPFKVDVQIWPNLREAHDANCNKGLSREELEQKYPQFNFVTCSEQWDYTPHTVAAATQRAERVRRDLKELTKVYKNIALVTHRGFVAFLVQGSRFDVCETRSYRFAEDDEVEALRYGTNVDTQAVQDFGPTVLVPVLESVEGIIEVEPKLE